MHKIKYLLGTAGICAILALTGCGTTASDSNSSGTSAAISETAEEGSSTEASGTSENNEGKSSEESEENSSGREENSSASSAETQNSSAGEDSSGSAKEKEEQARIKASKDQVPKSESAIKDASYSVRKKAKKGSLTSFNGKYLIQHAVGTYYYFDGGKTCYYVQGGTYRFTHGTNVNGEEADMIEMQFYSQSNPVQYTISAEDGDTTLTTIISGAQTETNIPVALVKGTDGLKSQKKFEGIYTLYGRDYYRYEFHKDGTYYLILDQTYSVKDHRLSLRSFGKTLTYDYQIKNGKVTLSSDGNTVSVLVPKK